MKYSFRNSAKGSEISITLDDYGFTLRANGKEEKISYANIVAVRISKVQNHVFRMFLHPDASRTIAISSLSWSADGIPKDQSREYALFVRVLHHHLKDKSPAVFTSGGDAGKIWKLVGISAFLSLSISLLIDYLGFGIMNPYTQALILGVVSTAISIGLSVRNFPKAYTPGDIPLQFLP